MSAAPRDKARVTVVVTPLVLLSAVSMSLVVAVAFPGQVVPIR
jgi:hypothetical protein